jgi:hypothetical protein
MLDGRRARSGMRHPWRGEDIRPGRLPQRRGTKQGEVQSRWWRNVDKYGSSRQSPRPRRRGYGRGRCYQRWARARKKMAVLWAGVASSGDVGRKRARRGRRRQVARHGGPWVGLETSRAEPGSARLGGARYRSEPSQARLGRLASSAIRLGSARCRLASRLEPAREPNL